MRLSGQFLAYLFFFVYKKILSSQKRKSNQNQLTKQKQPNKKQQRQQFFAHKNIWKMENCSLCVLVHFLCLNFFVQKLSRLEIVLITSFYYTTDVYRYQPTYQASIHMHLFLFVTICENHFGSAHIYDHLRESIF